MNLITSSGQMREGAIFRNWLINYSSSRRTVFSKFA